MILKRKWNQKQRKYNPTSGWLVIKSSQTNRVYMCRHDILTVDKFSPVMNYISQLRER